MLNRSLGRNALQLEYSPGQNCSGILEFNGAQIFLQRYSDGQAVTVGYDHQYMQPEVMSLRTWGQDASVLKEFLAAAVVTTEEDKGAEINIMCISDGWPGGWQKAVTKKVPTYPLARPTTRTRLNLPPLPTSGALAGLRGAGGVQRRQPPAEAPERRQAVPEPRGVVPMTAWRCTNYYNSP